MLDGELWLNRRPGKRVFVSAHGWSAFGFPMLNPKSRVLVSIMDVSSRDNTGESLGGRGDFGSQGQLGKSYWELIFVCDSPSCYLGHVLQGFVSV